MFRGIFLVRMQKSRDGSFFFTHFEVNDIWPKDKRQKIQPPVVLQNCNNFRGSSWLCHLIANFGKERQAWGKHHWKEEIKIFHLKKIPGLPKFAIFVQLQFCPKLKEKLSQIVTKKLQKCNLMLTFSIFFFTIIFTCVFCTHEKKTGLFFLCLLIFQIVLKATIKIANLQL